MAKKALGQHWLFDTGSLDAICDAAAVSTGDTILEVGPGLGTLTHRLLDRGAHVEAVELDSELVSDLLERFSGRSFVLHQQDIMRFDFSVLPHPYKVVANIPYYLTSHLLRLLAETTNRPQKAALLVQKEVAERVTAVPGEHSILSISMQLYANVSLGAVVPAELFSPPPKVDSRVLILEYYPKPLVDDPAAFLRLVKAGFSAPRKKLRSSLSGGLGISVDAAERLLAAADINPDRRAQTLSFDEWARLLKQHSPALF